MFALIVSLKVRADQLDRFRAGTVENAAASQRHEPGCRQFDVLEDAADPHRFFLYEVYDDEQAFERHKDSAHFRAWKAVAAECLEATGGQENTYLRKLWPGKEPT